MLNKPRHMTTGQAARRLGVTRRRVLALIAARRLAARRFGSAWMIEPAALDAPVIRDRKPGRPRKDKP